MKNLIYIKILVTIICLFLFSCNNITTQNTTQSPDNEIINMMGEIDSLTEGIFVSGNINESIDGSYRIEINKTSELFLHLNNANCYDMEIVHEATLDIIAGYVISFGYYKIDSNVLLLEDLNLKMKMTFRKENDSTLTCVEGFEYLKDKTMIYRHGGEVSTWLFDDYKFDLQKKRIKFITNKNRNIYVAKRIDGNYRNLAYWGINRELHIYEDNSYEFFIFDMLFSKGSYTVSSNEIILYDNSLNCQFYVYKTSKGLLGSLLPGGVDSDIYIKVK